MDKDGGRQPAIGAASRATCQGREFERTWLQMWTEN